MWFSSEICFGYLSRFEKTLQTTKSKLTNEKTNYNELKLLTTTNDHLQQEMTAYNKKGNNNQLQRTENVFKYAHNNQKYHKTKLLTLQKLNYKFKTTKQQLNCWMTDDCNITSYRKKSFAYHKENFIYLSKSLMW